MNVLDEINPCLQIVSMKSNTMHIIYERMEAKFLVTELSSALMSRWYRSIMSRHTSEKMIENISHK
jgi:hypothetical protein